MEYKLALDAGADLPAPLRAIGDRTVLPPLPLPGEVDIIMGGPPCQSFSGMNRHKVSFSEQNNIF